MFYFILKCLSYFIIFYTICPYAVGSILLSGHPIYYVIVSIVLLSVKVLHTCSHFFKYLKIYTFYHHKDIYFLKGNKIRYKIVVLCCTGRMRKT